MAAFLGLLAFIFAVLFAGMVAIYFQTRRELQIAQQERGRVQQRAQAALARYKGITDLERHKAELETRLNAARALLPRFQNLAEMEKYKEHLARTVSELKQADAQWRERMTAHESTLANLVAQVQSVEETLDMQSFGLYRPKYGFEDSEHYEHKLCIIRHAQTALVKSGKATECPQEWTVDGSVVKGRKMVKEHAKLMLRAFNGECDAAVAKVKYDNANNLENRINRSFGAINKLGESKRLWITREYLNLKLEELYLVHEHREKVHEEREQQRLIKEQMREEEKALREIEKAKEEAEREEAAKIKALERARQEIAQAEGQQIARLQSLVERLETELKDALERKAKAIARAQLTRSGTVYIISNIGSFGKDIYKIGLTRRLNAEERVDELSGASVPFDFDIHAMIYCEDAPALEHALHKYFASRRVNLVNPRREFFRVTLDEIRQAVKECFGTVTFRTVPEAEEYRKTLAMRQQLAKTDRNASPQAMPETVTAR